MSYFHNGHGCHYGMCYMSNNKYCCYPCGGGVRSYSHVKYDIETIYYRYCCCGICFYTQELQAFHFAGDTEHKVINEWVRQTHTLHYYINSYYLNGFNILINFSKPVTPHRQIMAFTTYVGQVIDFLMPILLERGVVDIVLQYYPLDI